MHKFNICDTKTLDVHFHSDIFRWQCGDFRSAYTAPAVLCGLQVLWIDFDSAYIARRTLSQQWRPSFQCERFLPDDGGVYATETCRSGSEPLKSLCHIY
jgi:hypothetical protein